MKYLIKVFTIIIVLATLPTNGQTRSGIVVGVQYESTSHQNPYVFVEGNSASSPISVTEYSDNTSHFYIPFGYSVFSKKGFGEVSSYALHMIVVGTMNLISPSKQYEYSTDKTYSGDSYADGYTPIFDDAGQFSVGNKGLEASFNDMDLFRFAFAGSMEEYISLPILLGGQGGLGNFGVHFAAIQEGHEPSEANNDYVGLVNFNETADLYFGVNTGYASEIIGGDLVILSVQYDWYFFIDGVDQIGDERKMEGSKLTVELTYFPFDHQSEYLKNMFIKAFYKSSDVPYMKQFAESIPTNYTFTKIGLGINYLIF